MNQIFDVKYVLLNIETVMDSKINPKRTKSKLGKRSKYITSCSVKINFQITRGPRL